MKTTLLIVLLAVMAGCNEQPQYSKKDVEIIVKNAYAQGLNRGVNICVDIQNNRNIKAASEYYSIDSVEMFKLYGLNQ